MRIAFIGQKGIPAHGGGVERYVEDIATRLASAAHEAVVFTRPRYTPKELSDYQGVRTISLPSLPTKHLDAITHSLLSTIAAIRMGADVIHYQSIGPALVAWIPKVFAPRIRVVSTLQSRDYQHRKWGAFARFMLRLGERIMCACSDELIVISGTMEKYVREKYGLSPIVIPNGANLPFSLEREGVTALNLPPSSYIVAISRLVPHKGISYLIEAFKGLDTDKKLVIVGDGSYTSEYVKQLKELASDDERIIFTGNRSGKTLEQLYANAAIFVQPSESEGLSLALLEAMANAIPVLVSDIPENLYAVEASGFSFRNRDAEDLRNRLRYILDNKEEALVKAQSARSRIEHFFDWNKLVPRLIEVYERERDIKGWVFITSKRFLARLSTIMPIF